MTFDVDLFIGSFMAIVLEALPFIVLGALVSGTLEVLLPQQWIASILPKRTSLAIGGSALLGLVFPMCECGIVPVMRRLLSKGLPLSCAVAYMLAAPIINPVVIASTWAAFSGDRIGVTSEVMVPMRIMSGFLVAFLVGLIVLRLQKNKDLYDLIQPIKGIKTYRPVEQQNEVVNEEVAELDHQHDESTATSTPPRRSFGQILKGISETSLHDFIDITCFLIIGALLAAFVNTVSLLDQIALPLNNPWVATPVMMIFAMLLSLCSEADAFVAANLTQVGTSEALLPLAGKLSFLVVGPMMDIKLYIMYTRVFRPRLIWTIISSVLILVFIFSLASHYLYVNFL